MPKIAIIPSPTNWLGMPVVGRIYKLSVAPTGNWWFWAVQLFPAEAADSGTAATREAAMAEFKAQWMQRRGWEHPWIRRS